MSMPQRTLADGTTVSAFALGAMLFGTRTDEATSFAILDRFVEAGGTLIDTSVAQLDELLAASELKLDDELRRLLDQAGRAAEPAAD